MTVIANSAGITPEALLEMPDGDDFELVDGRLAERQVSIDTSRVAMTVGRLLGNEAARTGEADVYANDLGYRCYPNELGKIRRPDASLVRRERLAGISGDRGFMPIPADLVVEVISKNDFSYEVVEKVQEYLSAGFPIVWVIHPNVKTVTIFHAGETTATTLHGDDEITAEPALAEFRCKVAAFFE